MSEDRRARRRAFSNDRVVDVAVDLIDEGGPDAVSIRSVAGRLGINPNAVYTYVASRADLERAVAERVLSAADADVLDDTTRAWADRVVSFAHAVRAALLEHPGVARLLMTAPMDGPAARAIGERLLGVFTAAGWDGDDAARLTYAVIVHVISSVALEVAETDGRPPLPPERKRVASRRAQLDGIDAQRWPLTAAAVDVMAGWVSTEQFEWGLRRILAGRNSEE